MEETNIVEAVSMNPWILIEDTIVEFRMIEAIVYDPVAPGVWLSPYSICLAALPHIGRLRHAKPRMEGEIIVGYEVRLTPDQAEHLVMWYDQWRNRK